MDENKIIYDKSCEPIVISKTLIDLLKKYDPKNWSKLLALYMFYYYTAKWQETNQIKATTPYTAKGIGWSIDLVYKYKKDLIKLNLIENIIIKNENNRIKGHYLKVKFVWSHDKVIEILENLKEDDPIFASPGKKPGQEKSQARKRRGGNALSNNRRNALRNNRENALSNNSDFFENSNSNSSHSKNGGSQSNKKISPFSESLDMLPPEFRRSQKFLSIWREWFEYRKACKKSMTIFTIKRQIKQLKDHSIEKAIKMIDQSILNGWQGIFDLKEGNKKPDNFRETKRSQSDWLKNKKITVIDMDKGV